MAITQDFVNRVCGPELRPEYLLYVFRSMQSEFSRLTMGSTHQTIYMPDVGQFSTPIPSVEDQDRIVAFIRANSKSIGTLIAKKARLLEMLREKRATLITQAVTKGLDSTIPMKDSGVEWLGKIPVHWQVRRIAMAVEKITNGFVRPTRDILVNDGVRYLQSLHIKGGRIDFDRGPYFVTAEWSEDHSKPVLAAGDVLVVQTGDVGEVCAVPLEYAGSNCHALIILRFKSGLGVGPFLSLFLQSDYGRNALQWSQTGALHPHLECGHVREIPIAVPPKSEQEMLIAQVSLWTAQVDALIAKVNAAVRHLGDFRPPSSLPPSPARSTSARKLHDRRNPRTCVRRSNRSKRKRSPGWCAKERAFELDLVSISHDLPLSRISWR